MDSDGDLQYDEDSAEEDDMMFDENDSGNESSGDEVAFDEHRPGPSTAHEAELAAEDFPFQVLSVQEIVQFMVVEINEVNEVAQVRDETSQVCDSGRADSSAQYVSWIFILLHTSSYCLPYM